MALKAHSTYICSCNMLWISATQSPAPAVPLSRERVKQLSDFYFPPHRVNNFFTRLLEVQVDVNTLTEKPTGLVMITPLEIVHAIYLKAAEELSNPSVTAAVKTAWAEALKLHCIRQIFPVSLLAWLSGSFKKFILINVHAPNLTTEDRSARSHDGLF